MRNSSGPASRRTTTEMLALCDTSRRQACTAASTETANVSVSALPHAADRAACTARPRTMDTNCGSRGTVSVNSNVLASTLHAEPAEEAIGHTPIRLDLLSQRID